MKFTLLIKFCLIICMVVGTNIVADAQEKTTEDSFSDYSYLWETTKKKKKSDKKRKTIDQKIEVTPVPIDTTWHNTDATDVATDTTIVENQSKENLTIDQSKIAQDSLNQMVQETVANEKDIPDFRSGLPPKTSASAINGGFTFTVIGGKTYAGFVFAPEINLGKVGFGIDLPILYGLDDRSVRTEMFKDGVGILRLIRYVRVGRQKVDPVYVKVGVLSGTMIGYGGLINNYTNSLSYEKRKMGLHYDVNIKGYGGIEGMYSDFDPTSLNLLVFRPYIRPLKWLPVPIIRTLEIGSTFVTDKDQTTLYTDALGNKSTYAFTQNGISAFGLDAGLTLLSIPFIQIDLFANYSKLKVTSDTLLQTIQLLHAINSKLPTAESFINGSGSSVGLNFRLHFLADLLSTDIRIERLNYTNNFAPQFFDSSYEIDKDARILNLVSTQQKSGIYGSLTGHILKIMKLGGSLLIPDHYDANTPATIAVYADVDRLGNKISIHANYYKSGLTDLGDAFKLDNRSVAKIRFVYHLNKFLVTGIDYNYTFKRTELGEIKTTKYISPYFGLNIKF